MSLAAQRCCRKCMELHPAPCAESLRCRRSHFTHAGFGRSAQGNKLQVRFRKFVLVDRPDRYVTNCILALKEKNHQFRPEKRAVSDPSLGRLGRPREHFVALGFSQSKATLFPKCFNQICQPHDTLAESQFTPCSWPLPLACLRSSAGLPNSSLSGE